MSRWACPSYFRRSILLAIVFLGFIASLVIPFSVRADEDGDKLRDLENKIKEYQSKVQEAQSQQKTLASTIEILNNQIFLTSARMTKTKQEITVLEEEIQDLSIKIHALETSLDTNTKILKERIEATYKRSFLPSAYLLLASQDFSEIFSRMKYFQVVQRNDKEVMYAMEESRLTFDAQKQLKESKQQELEVLENTLLEQTNLLNNQKGAKQSLLVATKNDEQKFQQLLAQVRSEYEAIQAIIAKRGDENEVGTVKAGDRIASVISGSSCNSNGTHLHFTVVDGGNVANPFSYLKGIDHQNCSGPGECSEGDAFNPSGSWDWPLNGPIRMNQGYGKTWAVSNSWVGQIYSFHNGIDIMGSSSEVKAVTEGTLFRGSYGGSSGCRLRYVRLEHKDSSVESYYLHVNY